MYLLDANVLIQAKNFYYRFDIFPAFWEWLDGEQQNGELASILPVYEELAKGTDELSNWTKGRQHNGWFLPVDDEATQREFSSIAAWVMGSHFKPQAKTDFLAVADPWLVAKAASMDYAVVTHEKLLDPNIRRKVKIPNVCDAFGVECIDTFDLLNRLGARF